MGDKVKVPLWQNLKNFAYVERDATKGAVLGKNLFYDNGSLVNIEDFQSAPANIAGKTLWNMIASVPSPVQALASASGTGFYSSAGVFRTFSDSSTIGWTNPSGASGAPSSAFIGDTDDVPEGSPKYFTDERAQDAVAAMFAAGTQTGITFTYNDTANSMSASVSGGSGGKLLQQVSASSANVVSVTGAIPADNTIPQNTEGDAYTDINVTITPTSSTSTLSVSIYFPLIAGAANGNMRIAVFRDSGANAVFATVVGSAAIWSFAQTVTFEVAAGSTSATTFTIRLGINTGTAYVNRTTGTAALFNGVMKAKMTVSEIAP